MITFCIPSKNNLRYVKSCVLSIKQNSYYKTNDILVYVDQDNDGTCEWLAQNKIDHIINPEADCKGIGYAYDTMFKEAKTDLVVAFHADMILGPAADYHLVKHHRRKSVVCSTRIEPPLHPLGPEKLVKDFGMWPEEIKLEEFNAFVIGEIQSKLDVTTSSSFAPWLIHRDDHLGHDPIFLSVFEDADLFRRFKLAGYEMIQSWSSYVYHLTCRGGQFEHAKTDVDFQTKSADWEHKNKVSMLEYIRKWGGLFKEYGPCEPRPNIKYNVGVKITNCPDQMLTSEPFFDQLLVDCDYTAYVNTHQANSSFNLSSKFVDQLSSDIQIEVDASKVADIEQFWYVVSNMEELMEQVDSNSLYEFGNVKITIQTKNARQPAYNLLNHS